MADKDSEPHHMARLILSIFICWLHECCTQQQVRKILHLMN